MSRPTTLIVRVEMLLSSSASGCLYPDGEVDRVATGGDETEPRSWPPTVVGAPENRGVRLWLSLIEIEGVGPRCGPALK